MLPVSTVRGATNLTGILRVATNYDYRGYTKSDNHPTAQANIDLALRDSFFLGAWVSTVDLDGADLELNPYVGKQFSLTPEWSLVTSLAGYFFDERVMGQRADYSEGLLQLDYRDLASLRFNIAPDYYGSGQTVLDTEMELRYPLSDATEASLGLGYQAGRKAVGYDNLYANIGVTWFLRPNLTLDLNYSPMHEMNERQHQTGAERVISEQDLDPPVILSVSLGF